MALIIFDDHIVRFQLEFCCLRQSLNVAYVVIYAYHNQSHDSQVFAFK